MINVLLSPAFLLILICLIVGVILRWTGQFPESSPKVLNGFVIWISLPALILVQIPGLLEKIEFHWELLIPVSMAWILFFLSLCFFMVLARFTFWSRRQIGALVLTAGLGNTSFVGFPLLRSLMGEEAIPVGILIDQLGSFLVLSSCGILFASFYSPREGKTVGARDVIRKVGTFPPLIALAFSVLLWALGILPREAALPVLQPLAGTLVPLALVAVGFQLKVSPLRFRRQWRPLMTGLSFKLICAPLFFYGLYWIALDSQSFTTRVTLLEAAMAPMITAGVVAEEFEFDGELSSLMIGLGIPVSLFTVAFWNILITG